jgi:hypothetical protein
MKTLLNIFHASFWLCVVCFLLLGIALFAPKDSTFFGVAAYGLPGVLLGGLVYSASVGLLADKHGKPGARWGAMSFLFGPVGLVVSYVSMLRLLRSGVPTDGSVLPSYSTTQKKWHWQLFLAFLVVLVVANVVARLIK